jgi:putative spermidine/putrescine transport system permease protein
MSCIGDVADVQYHAPMSRWQVRLESGEVFAAAVPDTNANGEFPRGRARATRVVARRCRAIDGDGSVVTALSTFLYRRPTLYVALLLIPPLLWFGTVYLGSLFTLLAQSIYSIDEFTAKIVYEPTLATYKQVVTQRANVDIIVRTLSMAIAVTIACAAIAVPIANYMVRYASARTRALFYVGVMLPMWMSYLVKVYAWR